MILNQYVPKNCSLVLFRHIYSSTVLSCPIKLHHFLSLNMTCSKEEEDQFQPIRRGSRLVSDARRRRYLQSKDDHEEVSPDRHSLSGSVEPATDVPQNFEETSDQPQPSRPSSKPTLAEVRNVAF